MVCDKGGRLKSWIYGLFRLDSSPISKADRSVRRIVGQRQARQNKVAFLFGYELDSYLLTWLGSAEPRAGLDMVLLCSAAVPESDLVDETAYAQLVADHLRLPMERVNDAFKVQCTAHVAEYMM